MKTKLQLSNKIGLKQQWLYASLGIGAVILVSTLIFIYINLGNSQDVLAATRNHTSKDNFKGFWKEASTWTKMHDYLADVPQNGTYYTAEVLGLITYESTTPTDVFTVGNGSTLDVTDTLVIKGDALFTGGGQINVLPSGVLVVYGDLSLSGGSNLTNQGRVVVTENIKTTGGGIIQNNAVGNNGFYTYGTKIQNGGGSYGTNHKNEAQLQANDLSLYNFVNDGGIILLPIVLDYFNAEVTSSNLILVEWGTLSEKDNDFFTLERSSDGKIFDAITTINGAGNSNQKLQYSFEDKKITKGYNYYRLKQTDYNGNFEYFKVVGVNYDGASARLKHSEVIIKSMAYPNPFKNEINLNFETESSGDIEVLIQNARGEIVYKEMVSANGGANNYKFSNADQLQSGVYYINVKGNKPQRIVKL